MTVPHLLLVAWLTAGAADATTTTIVKERYHGTELNPLLPQNTVAIDAIVMGDSLLGGWASMKLYPKHPKLAYLLTSVGVTIHGGAALHNSLQTDVRAISIDVHPFHLRH